MTREQLFALGLTRQAITRRVQAGRLHRLHRGVYAVGHTAVSQHGRWLAAVLSCGPGALLSHRSAAALWGLRPSSAPKIDVTVPRNSGRRSTKTIEVHRAKRTPRTHLGIPVTAPTCTLIDLAASPCWQLKRGAEIAERRGLLDARGRRFLAIETRSPLEDAFLALCDGLPRPLVNARVEGLEVDFHWPHARLVVETDGHEHHGTREAFERDRERDQRLIAAGWTVRRFTHRHLLEEPERVRAVLISVRSPSPATP